MNRLIRLARGGSAASLVFASTAGAWASGSSLGAAGSFNAFIFGQASVSGGGESEGAIAVGGLGLTSSQNAFYAANNYNIDISGVSGTLGSTTGIGLYVNGNVDFASGGQLNHGGNGFVSGNFTTSNPYDLNGGGSLSYGGSLSGTVHGTTTNADQVSNSYFTAQQTYSQNQSTALSQLAANATVNTNVANNWAVNYGGAVQNNKTYVVDLTAADLAGFGGNSVTLDLGNFNSTDSLIFDVSGSTVSNFGISINNLNGLQDRILWNFSTATSININNRQLEGSVLAPDATVNQTKVIEGNLIAENWYTTNAPEIHSYNYTGYAPTPPQAVPEPFTLTLGVGAIGLAARRKLRS